MEEPTEIRDRCIAFLEGGRLSEADELASGAVVRWPEDGPLWLALGLIRHRRGVFATACSALETAGLLVPLSPEARCALADCYARTKRGESARDLYRDLAEDGRCPTGLLPAVAAGLGALGEYGTALATCRELSRREPSDHRAHFGVAYYLRWIGAPPGAILRALGRAFRLAPRVPLYRIAFASLLNRVGRHDEAYELLQDVDLATIGCRCCLRRMMAIFLAAGDLPRAEACRSRVEPRSRFPFPDVREGPCD